MSTTTSLVRLLPLASPALPVGGYSYSQGLESAVDAGIVRTASDAERWIGDLCMHVLPQGELAEIGSGDRMPAFDRETRFRTHD